MFRIAMCLSVLRLTEDGNFEDNIVCLDIDYQTAKTIVSVILQHNIRVFLTPVRSRTDAFDKRR